MASELYIYDVGPLAEPMPDLIDTDKDPLPEDVESVTLGRAKPWEKEIGEIHTLQYQSINENDAVETILGKRPNGSSAYSSYYLNPNDATARKTFYFPDGTSAEITRAQLRPFYFTKREQVYLYRKKTIRCVEGLYIGDDDLPDRFLTKDDILELVKNFIIKNGECGYEYQSYSGPVYQLMYLYFTIDDNSKLIAVVD